MTALEKLHNPALAAFILRVALGIMLLAHGLLKIFVFTIPGTVGYFSSIGLPGFLAYLTILVEVAGGLALIAGLQVRAIALISIPLLLGAAVFGHGGNGWVFSNEGGGWEYPIFLALTALVQAFLGAGRFALDSKLVGQAPQTA